MKRKCLGAKLGRPEKTSCSGCRRIWDLRPNSETDLCPTPSRPEAKQPARMQLLLFYRNFHLSFLDPDYSFRIRVQSFFDVYLRKPKSSGFFTFQRSQFRRWSHSVPYFFKKPFEILKVPFVFYWLFSLFGRLKLYLYLSRDPVSDRKYSEGRLDLGVVQIFLYPQYWRVGVYFCLVIDQTSRIGQDS